MKARLCVLHFGEELFAIVGAVKHGYDALNMCNVFGKTARREDSAKGGRCRGRRTVEKSCTTELRRQFIVALWPHHQLHWQGGRDAVHGKVKEGGKQHEVRRHGAA